MVVRTPRIWSVCIAALLGAAAGCSSDDSNDGGDASDDADDGDDDADDGDDNGTDDDGADDDDGSDDGGVGPYTIEWGPVTVGPGVESTQCIRKRLPTDRAIRVGQIENNLGLASHHMIVYRLADGDETDAPEDCLPFVDVLDPEAGAPLAVTQKAEETIALPQGVAFTLEPGQLIRIELHYINATEEPQELRASSTFIELPEDEFEQEADFLFIGSPDINLPAAPDLPEQPDPVTLGPVSLPIPAELTGINVFAITGHQHQWGTDVQVSLATDPEEPGDPIYAPENFQWDEPETIYHDPPIQVPEGASFNFSCTWENKSESQVGFGESVDDEMCFFWAYYYPSQGAKICFTTEMFGGQDLCCPGHPFCPYIREFLENN
jgi:hypothetical protein